MQQRTNFIKKKKALVAIKKLVYVCMNDMNNIHTRKVIPCHKLDSFHFSPSTHKCNQGENDDNTLSVSWGSLEYILHGKCKFKTIRFYT